MTRKLKKSQDEDKFKAPEGLQTRIKHIQLGRFNAPLDELLAKARDREAEKYEDKSQPQSWFSKIIFSPPPDI